MTKPPLVAPDQLIQAITFLEGKGWDRNGVVMKKGDHTVVLTFEGQMIVDGDPATVPPELLVMAKKKASH